MDGFSIILSCIAIVISILSYWNSRNKRVHLIEALPKFNGAHQTSTKSTNLKVPLYNLGKGYMWDIRYKWIVTNKEFVDIINSQEEILQVFDNGQRYVVDSSGREKISIGNFQNEIGFVLPYEVSGEAVNIPIPSILQFAIEQFYEKEIKNGKEVSGVILTLKLEMDYINYKKRVISKATIFSLRLHEYELNKHGNIDKFNFAIFPDVKQNLK